MPPKRKISSSSSSSSSESSDSSDSSSFETLSRDKKKIKEYSNSITTLNSFSEKDERILSDIRRFSQPTEQRKLAKKLKKYYLYKKEKQLLFPTTLLDFMSLVNNLKLSAIDSKNYKAYQNEILAYFLTIIDTINIKVLYLISEGEHYYLSPLNLKSFRTKIRKQQTNIDDRDYVPKYIDRLNKQLTKQFIYQKTNDLYKIDASLYDFVFISSSFKKFNIFYYFYKYKVILNNIDLKQHYKASILRNTNHAISINKCNQYNILNTTWKPFNIYNFTGLKDYNGISIENNKIYYFDENERIDPEKKYDYYYLKHAVEPSFNTSTFTIHLYSNRASLKTKIYKQLEGGTKHEIIQRIPEVSVCSDVFFPNNLYDFCWFSSIINSLFYTDDISAIFLNKSIRNMDKTLKFLNDIHVDEQYKTINFKDQNELKKILKHIIYIMSFIYCSYSILSKNQLDERITNKKKWYEIYQTITNKETYKIIAEIILYLSNIRKIKE